MQDMSSASPSNLLGLMNQLQSLESSFTSILMEAALKLSSITDTNVFLLIESSEGRRISGKRHLCDAYLRGALTPTGSDAIFEVDPSVVALRQIPNVTPSTSLLASSYSGSDLNDSLSGSNSFQNSTLPTFPSSGSCGQNPGSSSRKRPSMPTQTSVPPKQRRSAAHPLPPAANHQSSLSAEDDDVKVEPDVDFKLEPFPESQTVSPSLTAGVDCDDDIAIIEDNSPVEAENESLQACRLADSSLRELNGGNFDSSQSFAANASFILPEDFIKKMEALQSLQTPSLFEKLSIEHRLFTSCVYQLGSVLAKQVVANPAHFSQPNQVEDFFNHHVTLWLSSFPYLGQCESAGMRIDTGKGGMAIGAFVRHRARNSFRKGCLASANKTLNVAY